MVDNTVTNFLRSELDKQTARSATATILEPMTPDAAAEGLALGKRLGVPASVASNAPDVFRKQAAQLDARDALKDAPKTQSWLQDRLNAAIAKDDLANLSWFERNMVRSPGALTRGVARGTVRTTAIPSQMRANASAQFLAGQGKTFDELYAEELAKVGGENAPLELRSTARQIAQIRADEARGATPEEYEAALQSGAADLAAARGILDRAADIPMSEGATAFRDEALANAENTLSGTLSAFASDPAGGAAFVVEIAAEILPVLLASTAVTAATRTPAAGVGVMAGGSFLTENTNSAMEFLAEQGADLSTPEAAMAVLMDQELMQAAADRGFARGAVIAVFDALSGGVAGAKLANSVVGDVVAQGFAQVALGSGGEAAAQLASGQEISWQDIVIEGLAELVTAPVEVGGVAGRAFIDRTKAAAKAGETAKRLAEIDEMAAKSKLKERSPDKFQEALEAQGGGDFYIPAQDVRRLFQAKDIAEEEAAAAWGVDLDDLIAADNEGRDVPVSAAVYAARIAGTEDADWVRDNATFDPDEMSLTEAQRFNDEVQDVMRQSFERVEEQRQSQEQMRASDVQVYDSVFSQLRAAGRTRDVAQNEARVWTAFWRTMGERYGADPLDLARSMSVRIEGPQSPDVVRRRGNLDIMLNTLRSQGDKALKPRGVGVLDFIAGEGGVQDRGGELEGMDVPKGVIAETASEVRERESQPSFEGVQPGKGMALDQIGRRLIEAGYFPEYMGGADITADGTVVDEAAIALEAISGAAAGRDRFPQGEGPDADLVALSEALNERGIDLALSNDEIAAALEEGDGLQYDQSVQEDLDALADELFAPIDRGEAFNRWAGDGHTFLEADQVNDESFTGQGPWVMRAYHGTTHDFEAFSSEEFGNKEGHFGAVNYFTTSEMDATRNYAGEGPDLTGRIETRAERIESEIEDQYAEVINTELDEDVRQDAFDQMAADFSSLNFDSGSVSFFDFVEDGDFDVMAFAREVARSELSGGEQRLLEVYVRSEKPFVVDEEKQGRTPYVEFRDREALRQKAIAQVAEDEGITVEELAANPDDFEDQVWGAETEIEADEPDALFEAMETVAARYDLDPRELYQAAEEFLYDGGPMGSFAQALRDSEAFRYIEDPEDGQIIGSHVLGQVIKELGYDAIVMKNANQRFSNMPMGGPTAHVHVFDENNANIKSVNNRGTFDPNDPRILYQGERSEKRGLIELPSGGLKSDETVIKLFETADLSTVLHESGHFFLEAFTALATSPDAPQAMRDDLSVIHKFLGVDGSKPLAREQHEAWARGFEAYLMEGKAPSLELADAFARFKAWLTRIYKTVLGLNVKVTPEVREVMDRMLATDAEIEAARDMQDMNPLFTNETAAGMTPAAWQAYQRTARRATEQASQKLLEKTMAKIRREKEKWWKAERADVRKEVETRVNSQREYRLIEAIANKKWIGSDRKVPDFQLDRAELVEMFGDGVLSEISRKRIGGRRALYAKGGDSLGVVADFFGFQNPSEMITTLQNAGKRKEVIDAETDRIMQDRYGDPLTDGTIEQEALDAIHSEEKAKSVATEARHLSARAGRPTRNLTAKVFRQRARMMIGRMSVKEATRPDAFLAAERRAAKGAEDAFAKVVRGNAPDTALATAARYKEQQLLNHYLYLESRDLTKMVQRKREKMRAYSKQSVREKLEGGYIEQIDAILEGYDFRQRSPGQVARAESLKDFIDRMEAEGRLSEMAIDERLADEANRKHYTRLTVDELQGLFDTIANIDHLGRFKQKLIEAQRQRDFMESVGKVAGSIRDNFKTRDPAKMYRGLQFLNLIRRPDTIMVSLDGGTELGAVYDELKRSIDEGQALEQQRGVEMVEKMDALFEAHYSKSDLQKMQRPRSIPGDASREWSKTEILAVALNTGNEDNFQRLMAQDVNTDSRMTQERLDALLAQLDENDWRFVQGMWDQINTLWPELAAIHKRRTGVTPKKVDGRAMVDAPGFVSGGYYPIKYDPVKSAAAQRDEQAAWDANVTAGHGATAAVRNGMTRQRQKTGGGRALLFDLSVPFQHMRETVRYIALSEAVDASWKILRHPEVVEAFQQTGMQDTQKTLELWIKDTARGPIYNTDLANSTARVVKNNFTLSKLAFNMKTVLLQVTGLGQSAAVIGKRSMARGAIKYASNPAGMIADVIQRSPLMAERQTTFQKDIYDFMNDTRTVGALESGVSKVRTNLAKAGFWPMIKTQFLVVDMPTWVGAYDAALSRGQSEDDAAHYADRMVVRAQDSGLFADRAAFERGTLSENTRQADFIRIFTTLGGYMLTKNNRAQVTLMQARQGFREADNSTQKIAAALNAASDLTLLFVFEAMVMGLIYAAMTDEEEDEDLKRFMLKETGIAVVGGIPMMRDAASAFSGFGGGGIYGSVLETPARVWEQANQGDIDKAMRRALGDVVGITTGLPTTATLRLYEGLNEGNTAEAIFGSNPLTR